MRIRRVIVILAILAPTAAGSILAGSAVPAAAHGSSAHVQVVAYVPHTLYHT